MAASPLGPLANYAIKGVLSGQIQTQIQKLVDTQVARMTGPLNARIAELERRVAELEGQSRHPVPRQPSYRTDDI